MASSGLALALALLLDPVLPDSASELHLAAVMASAWYGGLGPGVLATALGVLSLTLVSGGSVDIAEPVPLIRSMLAFVVVALLISWLSGNLRRSRQHAEAARAQAQAALRSREDVLHAVSHDLRQPLAIIRLIAGTLHDQVEDVALPERRALLAGLARIETHAAKTAGVIADLLEAARLQGGQPLLLDRQPTDLVDLARRVAAEHQRGAERHVISVRGPTRGVYGLWDPRRLERVLDNLLTNAVKYSPSGGLIEVDVTLAEPSLARLSVRDHGPGVPPDERPHLFDRFYRTHQARQATGFGLGLSICRQFIELHGGRIAAEFPADGGTRVVVALPVGQVHDAASGGSQAAA